jgi:hypothetical protein
MSNKDKSEDTSSGITQADMSDILTNFWGSETSRGLFWAGNGDELLSGRLLDGCKWELSHCPSLTKPTPV